jgi:methylamine dehydrogenase accessory protein MauD
MPIGWAVVIVILCVAVVVLSIIVLGLLRQVTPVLERAAGLVASLQNDGPPVGQRVPDFTATGADGEVTAESLLGQPSVLLFLSVGCGPCEQLAVQLRGADLNELTGQLVVVTEPGGPQELGLPATLQVLTEPDGEVSHALSVNGTPLAVALDRDGIVRAVRVTNTVGQLNEISTAAAAPAPSEDTARAR